MSIVERELLRRFATRTLLLLFLFSWLALSIDATHELGGGRGGLDAEDLVRSLLRHVRALEIAIAIAAPLALILVLRAVRQRGILTVAFAAGLRPAVLRRLLLIMALGTAIASAGLQEAASLTYAREVDEPVDELMVGNGVRLWCRRLPGEEPALSRIVAFRDGDLDVTWSPGALWSEEKAAFVFEAGKVLSGDGVPLDTFVPRDGRLRPLVPRPLSGAFGSGASLCGILAALNRVGVGALLLLLAGYVTLLCRESRPWQPFLVFLFLVPAVGLGTVSTLLLLWRESAVGIVAEAVWLTLAVGSVIALEVRFRRRGLTA